MLATRARKLIVVRGCARRSTAAPMPRPLSVLTSRSGDPCEGTVAVVPERFDAAYYRRFYGQRPVHDRRRIGQLAAAAFRVARGAPAVCGVAGWWRLPIRSVLDVGAGKGYWGDWVAANRPRVRYHGIDV